MTELYKPTPRDPTSLSRNVTKLTSSNDGQPKRKKKAGVSVKQMRMRIILDDPLYKGMKKIKISGKELSTLPGALFSIFELQVLDMSPEREACLFYHLTKIPTEIARLNQLNVLCVDTNKLTELPESIGELSNLQRLAISNNLIKDLPDSFVNLKNLRSLHCANNQFSVIPPVITKLLNLTFLDFSDNQLTRIPEDVGNLENLDSLNLSYNLIEFLPESICRLQNLSMLWLCMNKIKQLPRGFGGLKKLDWSWMILSTMLDGNPLIHPPMSVAQQGPAAIEKYLSLHHMEHNGLEG